MECVGSQSQRGLRSMVPSDKVRFQCQTQTTVRQTSSCSEKSPTTNSGYLLLNRRGGEFSLKGFFFSVKIVPWAFWIIARDFLFFFFFIKCCEIAAVLLPHPSRRLQLQPFKTFVKTQQFEAYRQKASKWKIKINSF